MERRGTMNSEMKPAHSGRQLKYFRKKNKLTLEQLAAKTELSASYISKIEREIISPSADAIQKLSYALNLTANELILPHPEETEPPEEKPRSRESYVLHKEERSLIYEFGDILSFEALLDENSHFKVNVLSFPGNANEGMRSVHSYDEFGIVARGILEMTLGDGRVFQIKEGECIMVRAQTSHASRSLSPEGCISYWVEILDK